MRHWANLIEYSINNPIEIIKEASKKRIQTPSELLNNANFMAWFKDSQVVDHNNVPLMVHHGTSTAFTSFDHRRSIGGQYWFTSSKSEIEAGEIGAQGSGIILDCYLSIQNGASWKEYDKYGTDELIRAGFDGIILTGENETTFVIFEPSQAKLISNNGGWQSNTKHMGR